MASSSGSSPAAEAGPGGINRDVLGLMMTGIGPEEARERAAEHHTLLGEADLEAEAEAADAGPVAPPTPTTPTTPPATGTVDDAPVEETR